MTNGNGNSSEAGGMKDSTRETLARRLLGTAWAKAEKLQPGETVTAALRPADLPKGVHYDEISGRVVLSLAKKFGLEVVSHQEWTYVFKKL